jgi:hypothetical protein
VVGVGGLMGEAEATALQAGDSPASKSRPSSLPFVTPLLADT